MVASVDMQKRIGPEAQDSPEDLGSLYSFIQLYSPSVKNTLQSQNKLLLQKCPAGLLARLEVGGYALGRVHDSVGSW